MVCVLENLKKTATGLSSLSFFSVSVILTLEDFFSVRLKSCPRSSFLLCFLPFAVRAFKHAWLTVAATQMR